MGIEVRLFSFLMILSKRRRIAFFCLVSTAFFAIDSSDNLGSQLLLLFFFLFASYTHQAFFCSFSLLEPRKFFLAYCYPYIKQKLLVDVIDVTNPLRGDDCKCVVCAHAVGSALKHNERVTVVRFQGWWKITQLGLVTKT